MITWTDFTSIRCLIEYHIRSFCYDIPTDPSLTCSSLLAAVQSVSAQDLAQYILYVSDYKKRKLLHDFSDDDDYKEACVLWYLQTHPHASWEHLGGRLLWWGENEALQKVKGHITPKPGVHF